MNDALVELYERQGQSPWLDFIRRDMLENGGLKRYVEAIGIRGVTANPTIFERAIGSGDDYDVAALSGRPVRAEGRDSQTSLSFTIWSERSFCSWIAPSVGMR